MVTGESIFHNVDLLAEILLRLPSKSVIRFKSVCKSWQSLITSGYFCFLWRKNHQGRPGILLSTVGEDDGKHRYVPLSGGVPQLDIPRDARSFILQSFNGFLLHMNPSQTPTYWVYNPLTREVVSVPQRLEQDACKIHYRRRPCCCSIIRPGLARGRVVALSQAARRTVREFVYQVCVTDNQGLAWRCTGKPFRTRCSLFSSAVHWQKHNLIVWISASLTCFYDVEGEAWRMGASPQCWTTRNMYHLGEYGGHLHFIDKRGSCIIIQEMKHDLSGWFVKHSIELSQIKASLFKSVGWGINSDEKFEITFLIEDEEDSKLVVGCHQDVVFYRIQDQKSWKICEWDFTENKRLHQDYFMKSAAHEHIETISRFHDQY